MALNTLTDARCKAAKPAEKPPKIFDGSCAWVPPKVGEPQRFVSIPPFWAKRICVEKFR